ncbi:MAG: thrombospondin type 3 repeat-containing protein [Planctomycetaceae bacterium]|nr:thrombospondin type 3 repeat-containing protein [Planctomycetaceae bacterium]
MVSVRASAQDIHISQVYGGGGNTGAPFNADFVELYNAGTTTASIGGWTLTYASATGNFGGSQFTLPPGTLIPPGGYLLIQMSAAGGTGAALSPDLVANPAIGMAADNANVALLSAAQSGTSNNCASLAATLIDKVAYGSGNCPEGSAVGALSSTTAAIRKANGATDTNSNSSDFFIGTPFPRNLAMRQAAIAETGSSPTADGWTVATSGTTSSGVANSDVGNPSWTLGATTSSTASATRTVTASAGMRAAIDVDHGTVPSGATVGVEFLSGSTTVMTFRLVGGASNYTLIDSSGTVTTTLAATTSGVRLALAVGASGAYTLTANTYSRSGTLAGSGTAISAVRVFNNGAGNTASTVLSFNHPAVSISTASLTSTVNASTTSIPDNNASGRTISIPFTAAQIPSGLAVRDVRVTLNTLTHGNAGDIVGAVTAPGGGTATFLSLLGPGETSNFGGNYAFADEFTSNLFTAAGGVSGSTTIPVGNYHPSSTSNGVRSALASPLAVSGNGVGTWTVRVSDQVNNNTGTVASATLELRLGFDSDGDGVVDQFDGCPTNGSLTAPATYYVDADGDGFGGTTTTTSCSNTPPAGASSVNTDCDDTNNARYPGATEICDGIDQDCDGAADDGFADTDGDGIGDCVDAYVTYTMTGASIPDATNATPPVVGVLARTFSVTTAQIPNGITDIRVRLNALSHTWIGDLTVQLIAPNGTTASIFTRPGFTGGTSSGDSSDFNGNYLFDDPATQSLWTAATTAAATAAIPAGSYFPSAATNGARVALTSAFSSVPTTGTWTVRITDAINQDVGSVGTIIVEFDPAPIVDTDGDGTPDSSDGCPNDPNKIAPGACGCGTADTDTDGDGTPNCNDGCPNDPNKTAAGTCGCGIADTDSDNDGTPNCNDGCPNDPNKTAPGLCGCGTADTDTDGDGTPNCNDGCPNDPNKTAPGLCGCGTADTDTDGDGTPNCTDGCPNDPNKIAAGTCGCGVAETDSDNDGTPNCTDGCPNDPNKIAAGTCGCGIAETDSDNDGTPNCNDGCPNDPNKIAAGACGCGVADTDTDSDGTPDCNDGCPNDPADPAKIAPGLCGCGTADTDTDGDGTPNCTDGCPNDPSKIAAGACGCGVAETDSDNDGTPNCNDGCPNDPNKTAAGACGCGVAETDSDNDGTPNCNDGCPADPNKTAAGACGCGVAETDSDNDGTPNCNDGCPNDPNKTAPGNCGCGFPESNGDSDNDGTPDCSDGCPNDPNKTAPGVCGCGVVENAADPDGDGTPNCADGCPNDPNKTAPGACGCGVAETDSDGDGTPNCNDGCPNDPNKIAAGTCGCGIADTDTDGDGTPNCNDGCPNDPNKIAAGTCGCGIADTDTDGDGTPNCNDGCPNDPNKTVAGACGCGSAETDSDGDGTPDCVDGCPNDPNKIAAGACGCGVADADTDSDGTPDCNDGCPNDPNKTAPGLCGCGVADTDTDNDGTPNCNDGCPNDPNKIAAGACGCGVADTDTDNDGTPDCTDGCPNDPAKTAPGLCGCGTADTDTDNDGTPDCTDGCPNDPNKVVAGACGCGVADTDSDGDGTPNCNDGCPNDPNKVAAGVCGCGVADTDTDNDGTPNCNDGCPNDPNKVAAGACGCGVPDTDTDNDGTPNCTDGCPNDPAKTAPGLCGCGTADTDTDSDGTPNCSDGCPNDPAKTAPGVCGCGVADTDSDNDGTPNCNDGCPNDPAKIAPGVCGCGVADSDSDGDGTLNCNDGCPNDPAKIAPGVCGCGVADTDSDGDGTPNCNDTTFSYSLTGGSIPDASATGLVKTFTVSAGQLPNGFSNIRVTLTGLTHTWAGDVTATLAAPDGTAIPLVARISATATAPNGEDSDFGGTYVFDDAFNTSIWTAAGTVAAAVAIPAGDYYPSAATTGARVDLTNGLKGRGMTGTWTLRITDTVSQDTGSLGSAKIDFTPAESGDADGDGTPNGLDACPNDPLKTLPSGCGCGVADTDADGDGTLDCNDPSYTVSLTGGSVPDNSTTGLVKTFTIANGTFPYGITAVKVTLTGLTHGNCGDLTATLTGPSGASATIFGRVGATSATGTGDTSNYGGDYVFFDAATASLWTAAANVGGNGTVATGDYYPSVALTGARGNLTSPFAGTNLSGTWTLRITDTISSNSGTLGSARVDFTPAEPVDSDGDGVPDGSDGCPNDPNKTASGACGCGVAETDSDGDGTPNCNDACPNDPTKIAVGACGCGVAETDSDNDGTPNCVDGCPNDPNKSASGACGCGSPDTDLDGNGTPDCSETTPTVSLAVVGGGAVFGAGDTVTVQVAYSNPARVITQARLSLLFNTSALLAVDVRTPEGGAFSQSTTESIDQGAGTIRSVVTAPGGAGSSGATVVDIDFVVLPGASACSNAGLVTFGSIEGASTELISAAGETVSLSTTPLPAIRADGVPPALAGVPSNATLSVDAGSIVGAAIAEPVVTAIDGCDGARSVALTITYPGGGTASAWPFDGIFPIGVTTLAYASTDVASNTTTATRTITVLDQQLVDLTITLGGDFAGASTRLMRIESGGVTQTTQVAMTGTSGVATGIAIPVSATPPCIRLKDVGHSVSRVGTATDSGARWSLSLTLPQGDSNDDDVVDIIDFAIFVANRGAASTAAGISNFNADLIVNNADLGFIGLNYFAQGETCGGFGPPQAPRERVRVIDLVRAGMRDLAAADLDRDGWVSQSDIAAYLSGNASPPPTPRPIRRPLPNGSETPVERDW